MMEEYKNTYYRPAQKYNTDMALYAAGHAKCLPDESYGPTVRQYHVLHFVLNGKGRLEIKDQELEIQAGQVFLIPAGTIARYEAIPQDPWEYCWVNFYGLHADRYVDTLVYGLPTRYSTMVPDTQFYFHQIQNLLELEDSTLPSVFDSLSILYKILGHLSREIGMEALQSINHNVIEDVKFYIDMNISENFRIWELAEMFNIHQNYLIRKFTDTYGISPKQYILDVKLARARDMLEKTEDPINLIALSLGFADQTAFSKTFKKKYGYSPSALRAKTLL